MARYTEVANNVQTQETILNIQFVLLDCSPLKAAILAHCQEWQSKFTTLLSEIAITCLKDLNTFLKENAQRSVRCFAVCVSCKLLQHKGSFAQCLSLSLIRENQFRSL